MPELQVPGMQRALLIGRRMPVLAVAAAVACAPNSTAEVPGSAAERTTVDLSHLFRSFGADGTFVLYDDTADRVTVHDPERATRGFLPASTFKILNSLIALEVGAVADEHEIIPWDGVDRGDWWNGDQVLTRAFQRSSVWVYQELARRTGEARMRDWVERVGYGNADIAGGIDRFWLDGALRISAQQQIGFLRQLHAGTLPFSGRNQSIVRDLMLFEEGDGYVIRGKTGWTRPAGLQQGWLVGWVERGADTFFFATHIESTDAGIPMQRAQREITRGALRQLGVLPQRPPDDRGVGVIGFAGSGPDTLQIRSQPAQSAPLVAELRRRWDGPYELIPHEVRPNLVEYAYEIQGIPFDSTAGSWARVIYGSRLDERPVHGWVSLADPGVYSGYWRDLLLERRLTFPAGAPAELFGSRGGTALELAQLSSHVSVMNYDLDPIRAAGPWLLVRVRAPSFCSEQQAAVDTTAWIRHLDADDRPLVLPRTRGC